MKRLNWAGITLIYLTTAIFGFAQGSSRTLQIVSTNGSPGAAITVAVQLVSLGNENALSFSLNFDPTRLSYTGAVLGSGAAGTSLLLATNQISGGRLGISVARAPGQSFAAGVLELVRVTFLAGTTTGATVISFGDAPLAREILDAAVNDLTAMYSNGTATVQAGDSDGDGFTDTQELIAGTDPLNPADYLRITDVSQSGADVLVSFSAVAGKVYTVESKDSLTNANWVTKLVINNTVAGIFTLVDPGAAGSTSTRFYHIVTGPNREVISDPAGFYSLPLNPRANALSIPLHRMDTARGLVVSISGNTVRLNGTSVWPVNAFAPTNNFNQYILIVLNDATTTGSPGIQGDWWPIVSNTANSVTVNPGSDNLAGLLAAGSSFAIRKLNSLKDLFGSGSTLILNPDSTGAAAGGDSSKADVIRFLVGTSFGPSIFYHDGSILPAGYYVGSSGPLDGSSITVPPGQAFMVFRAPNSATTNFVVKGGVHTRRMTQYLLLGANPVGSPFAATAAIGTSNLKESGWNQDGTGAASTGDYSNADLFRPILGTSFDTSVFYHNGALLSAGWYQGGTLNNNYPLQPGLAYIFFIKGPNPERWRQAVPYSPY